jgi:hypothetical protein
MKKFTLRKSILIIGILLVAALLYFNISNKNNNNKENFFDRLIKYYDRTAVACDLLDENECEQQNNRCKATYAESTCIDKPGSFCLHNPEGPSFKSCVNK